MCTHMQTHKINKRMWGEEKKRVIRDQAKSCGEKEERRNFKTSIEVMVMHEVGEAG